MSLLRAGQPSPVRGGRWVIASGVVILAGCGGASHPRLAGAGAGPPFTTAPLEAALGGVEEAAPAEEAAGALERDQMPSPWRTGLVGAEFGLYLFRDDDIGDWFGDASYGGIKFAWEPGLNWGVSVSAGYYKGESVVKGGEDIEVFPLRATLEFGGLLFFSQSRWFVGAGGGYAYMEEVPSEDKIDLWPARGLHLDDEWTTHVVGGFEFRNESIIALRAEGGHTWLIESDVDVWMVTGTLSLQF